GGDDPLRLVCPGAVGEAETAAASWNNSSRLLLRPGGDSLRRQRRGRGGLSRSPRPVSSRRWQVAMLLAFFLMGAEQAVGGAVDGWLDLARPSLDGGGRRRRAQIWELEELGCVPGRRATADGFFNFDSNQSHSAMGLLQFMAVGFFSGGDGRRRRGRFQVAPEGSRDFFVIFYLIRVLSEVWLLQLPLYPLRTFLYLYVYMYVFLI
ncbi:unnamed protein product, partial [Urochloa humidicola]